MYLYSTFQATHSAFHWTHYSFSLVAVSYICSHSRPGADWQKLGSVEQPLWHEDKVGWRGIWTGNPSIIGQPTLQSEPQSPHDGLIKLHQQLSLISNDTCTRLFVYWVNEMISLIFWRSRGDWASLEVWQQSPLIRIQKESQSLSTFISEKKQLGFKYVRFKFSCECYIEATSRFCSYLLQMSTALWKASTCGG